MGKIATVACVLASAWLILLIGYRRPVDAAPVFRGRSLSALLSKKTLGREDLQLKIDFLRASQQKAGTINSSAVSSSFECDVCDVVVGIIQELFLGERTEEEVESIITAICIDLKLYDHNVCSLAILEFKDEVLDVVDRVVLSSREICGALLGPSCAKTYNPYDQEWNISIPDNKPPVTPVLPPKPGYPVNHILHLTDMHFDRLYTPGLSNDCGEPLCCRLPNPPGNGSTAAGYWGDYNCDVPYQTTVNLMQHLQSINDQFDWIYLTGDLPAHNVWNQTREDQLYVLDTLMALFHKYLPDKMLFAAIGNHESAPVNSFPPPYITGYQSNQWLLDALAEQWSSWLSKLPDWPEANKTIRKGGYYNVKIREGLRVISMQTNYANSGNYWLLINSTDPANQLTWLVQQLLAAEQNGEKVHIIGHILPGSTMKYWGHNFYRIVNRFESTIVGQFYGHTHNDLFQVFFDEQNITRATSVAIMGPAVTTYQGLNMGFRIHEIDGDYSGTTNAMLDNECYYLNVSDANLTNKPKWQFEYSAKATFGMPSIQPADWANLIKKFDEDDALFQKFYQFKYKMHPPDPVCDANCKTSLLCDLQKAETGSSCSHVPITFAPGYTTEDFVLYQKKHEMC